MPFTPRTWANGSAGGTAIDAANLNRMEAGIDLAVAAVEDTTAIHTDIRAQVEAMLAAGANVTLTPSGSGASRVLTIASSGGGGGGGGGTAPTFRGSASTANGGTSFTLALPGGTVAGDTAFAFVAGGNLILHPTGFAEIESGQAFSGLSAGVFRKVLDAADITAGTVTFNTSASFYTVVALVVYVGTVNPIALITEHKDASYVTIFQNKAWVTNRELTLTDELLIVQATRTNTASTSSIGTLLQNNQGTVSMSAYRYPVATAGAVEHTVNVPAAGFEIYFWRLVVRGI